MVQHHRPMGHEPTGADFSTHADTAEVSVAWPDPGGAEQVASGSTGGPSAYRAARSVNRLVRSAALWLWLFAISLGLFIVRFLVPTPGGQADNHHGPRVMCDLGVWAVPLRLLRIRSLSEGQQTAPGTTCGNHRANSPRHPRASLGMVFAVQAREPTRRAGRIPCRIPPYKRGVRRFKSYCAHWI